MSKNKVDAIEDLMKTLLNEDFAMIKQLRSLDRDERSKLVHDAIEKILPDFINCINNSFDTEIPRLMYIGCFDIVWRSIENEVKSTMNE